MRIFSQLWKSYVERRINITSGRLQLQIWMSYEDFALPTNMWKLKGIWSSMQVMSKSWDGS